MIRSWHNVSSRIVFIVNNGKFEIISFILKKMERRNVQCKYINFNHIDRKISLERWRFLRNLDMVLWK